MLACVATCIHVLFSRAILGGFSLPCPLPIAANGVFSGVVFEIYFNL